MATVVVSAMGFLVLDVRSAAPPGRGAGMSGAVDALHLTLGGLHGALRVLASGANIREHVEHHEIRDRGCGFLAH